MLCVEEGNELYYGNFSANARLAVSRWAELMVSQASEARPWLTARARMGLLFFRSWLPKPAPGGRSGGAVFGYEVLGDKRAALGLVRHDEDEGVGVVFRKLAAGTAEVFVTAVP